MRKLPKFLMISALFLMAMFVVITTGRAEEVLKPLPEVEALDANVFAAQSQMVKQNYPDNPDFDFNMQIPNELRVIPQNQLINERRNGHVSGIIFQATGPATNALRPYVTVSVHDLKRLISAKNWFVTRVLRLGYTLRGIDADDDRTDFDAFYVRLDPNGNTEIVRGRGFFNGDQVVMVEYSIPVELWGTDRDKQIFAIKSFEFTHDFDVTPPESMQKYSYLDSFHTQYPKGWRYKMGQNTKVNELGFNLKTTDNVGFLIAEIDFDVLSERSLRDRIDKTIYPVDLAGVIREKQKAISDKGYSFDEHIPQSPIPVEFETELNLTEVYPLRRKTSDIYLNTNENPISKEYWITAVRRADGDGKNYIITMTAPYRMNNMEQWAVAVETYRHMIKSIR